MLRYILLRVAWMPVGILFVVSILFFLVRLTPGGAVVAALGPYTTVEQVDAFKKEHGLDRPVGVQYINYIGDLLHGNLGESIVRGTAVSSEIGVFLPASVELVLLSVGLIILLGVPLGVVAAIHKDRWPDFFARGLSIGGVSMPPFWLAIMLLLLFYYVLGWLPSGGRISISVGPPTRITGLYTIDSLLTGNWRALGSAVLHMLLPALTLAITSISSTTRLTRDGMLKALKEEFTTVAWAYGIKRRKIYFKYALKNGIMPTITNLGMLSARLFGGAFIVETVFSFPGLGYFATSALLYQDYASITGAAIVISSLFLVANLVVDVIHLAVDPRIRS
ncbi:ABC transporter permease [Candidatus Bipolaricaulota bacterium]